MAVTRGRVLIADDEPTFLSSTTELLRREGYGVEAVDRGEHALAAIAREPFDLLITDLEMPGNADLDLVQQVAHASGGLPIIIVTGFPSVRSAVASIELPVTAYLIKPVHFPLLLKHVSASVARFRSFQAMTRTELRLRELREGVVPQPTSAAMADPRSGAADAFLTLALRNVMGSLTDLEQLGRALAGQGTGEPFSCQLVNCARGAQLRCAVEETIGVLEETRHAFKSKQLGELRERLELLLQHG